jgi:hypothetical protein
LQRVKGETLVVEGRFPHSVGKMSRSDKRGRAVSLVVGLKNLDIIHLAFRLEILNFHERQFKKTKTNNTRGRIETPPLANLSALSFRLHKKGHACRGMSDIEKYYVG